MTLNFYLMFNGTCEAAFKFYEKLLGGKIEAMLTHRGSPVEAETSPEFLDKILHTRMTVGNYVLMGSDSPPNYHQPAQGFAVNIGIDDVAEAERVFTALADNGQVKMAFEETFWATRFGMVVDRFGTPWMINCGSKPVGNA
ncbi:VOC family protein [Andreprevotia chitinilytica]|uniref:VOC family protein n=1 Tax=Andreprevotia chitinilytica TaxID=396808 RepID=UPI0005535E66|nr:VOC family protein [Andreprevotia chitinilytica]